MRINVKIYIKYLTYRMQRGDQHKVKIYSIPVFELHCNQHLPLSSTILWGSRGILRNLEQDTPSRCQNSLSEDRKWGKGGENTEMTYTADEERNAPFCAPRCWWGRISDKGRISLSHTHARTHRHTHLTALVAFTEQDPLRKHRGQKHSQQSIPLCLSLSS